MKNMKKILSIISVLIIISILASIFVFAEGAVLPPIPREDQGGSGGSTLDEDELPVVIHDPSEEPETPKYGDATGDGEIDMKDIVLLRNYLAEYNYTTGTSSVAIGAGADANGDKVIDMKDIVLLRSYLAEYDYSTGTSPVPLGPQK